MSKKHSFPKDKIKILLLEAIHPAAVELFTDNEYVSIECLDDSPSPEELIKLARNAHIIGIRSKTNLTKEFFNETNNLLAVGCFCIGTNQVDLDYASKKGVAVFNAPFSNTRSVAELTIAEIIMLARKACQRSAELHQGIWTKSASGSYEVRHKTIGIIGYGHIGPQVGLLAEALGMQVLFYDIQPKLALGNAKATKNLAELLQQSDFVTLHVPETADTKNLIGQKELALMKRGSYLLNLSRGSVVDLNALAEAIQKEHLAGAALDVYPYEPASNKEKFESAVCGLPNVILTPHIGGSTLEAQKNIGIEVASSLVRYTDQGCTTSSVNFPIIDLPINQDTHRILNVHKNVPGVLSQINKIIAEMNVNISAQYLGTNQQIGYLIMDVGSNVSKKVKDAIDAMDTNIKTRLLF
jgi:D-3-phosphoglycerate dehydrogenase